MLLTRLKNNYIVAYGSKNQQKVTISQTIIEFYQRIP